MNVGKIGSLKVSREDSLGKISFSRSPSCIVLRAVLKLQQARRRGGSKGSNEPPLKFDNGGLKYK